MKTCLTNCRGRRDHKRPATAADHGANLSNRLITSSARSQTTGPADGAICFWQSRGQRDQDRPAAKAEIRCDRDRPTNLELSAIAQRLAELPQPRGVRSRVTDRTRAQDDHTRPAELLENFSFPTQIPARSRATGCCWGDRRDRRRPAGLWLRRDHAALGVDRCGVGSRLVLEYGLKSPTTVVTIVNFFGSRVVVSRFR